MRINKTIVIIGIVSLPCIGAILGWYSHKLKYGYYFKVHEAKDYKSKVGTVSLKYITESTGVPFMDPGKCLITIEDKSGSVITVYKSARVFQESYPMVNSITIEGDQIVWDDGLNSYNLICVPK